MALQADHACRLGLFEELRFEFFGGETEDDVHLGTAARADGVAEISEILSIAEGTVSSRLSRARSKLQKELKGE